MQLGQSGLEGEVSEQGGQQDDAPENRDGEIVAAGAAGGAEAVEEFLIGDGLEEVADGPQAGSVFKPAPGEQRLGGVDAHGCTSSWGKRRG